MRRAEKSCNPTFEHVRTSTLLHVDYVEYCHQRKATGGSGSGRSEGPGPVVCTSSHVGPLRERLSLQRDERVSPSRFQSHCLAEHELPGEQSQERRPRRVLVRH